MSTFGLSNKWHQSKDWGTLRKKQQLEFILRQIKRENQKQIGSCMKKISKECKSMLKNKMKEVIQHNTTLNQPKSDDRYKNYKCFQCKQLGHIVKSCPMNYKVENTDAKKETKRRMEGIQAIKPTVMITYPETIHFSTTCMIKDTDLTSWDEIWYVSNQIDRHVCYKLDAFCTIKEGFSVTKLENQKKFQFTYGMGEVLIEEGGKSLIVPGVFYAPEDKETRTFDEDRMRKMHNQYLQDYFESITKKEEGMEQDLVRIKENLGGYLSVHFSQEFDMVGEIMGLSKGNGEEVRKCYMNYLEVFTSHFKTARAPRQGHNDAVVEFAWKAQKDKECLGSHQWEIGENGAQKIRPAVLKGKKIMEHFDVQLEDTTKSPEEPTQVHYKGYQKFQKMYTVPSSSRIKKEHGSSTSNARHNLVIGRNYGAANVMKDGITVAKNLKFKDEVKNICISLVNSQVANATNDGLLMAHMVLLLSPSNPHVKALAVPILAGLEEKFAEVAKRDDKVHKTGDISVLPDVPVALLTNTPKDCKKPIVSAARCCTWGWPRCCNAHIGAPKTQLGLPESSLGVMIGFLALLTRLSVLYFMAKKRKMAKLRGNFYEHNGGALLEEKLKTTGDYGVGFMKVFQFEELKEATGNYAEDRSIGRGGNGIVYEGT
nr:ARID DNA-binding domain-containing protein [Tanacetum cinerariifolium]